MGGVPHPDLVGVPHQLDGVLPISPIRKDGGTPVGNDRASPIGKDGVPPVRKDWVPSTRKDGGSPPTTGRMVVPYQEGWGTPVGKDGGTPHLGLDGATPRSGLDGVPPSRQSSTYYAAGSMSLAQTQEDFLVSFDFMRTVRWRLSYSVSQILRFVYMLMWLFKGYY